MNTEEIFINLKVLESLNKNQKVISRGPYLNIEPNSIIPEFVRRWHRQDSRDEMLKKVNLVVNSAIEIIIKTSKERKPGTTTDVVLGGGLPGNEVGASHQLGQNASGEIFGMSSRREDHNMIVYLENSLQGIKNLKETYATCNQTCARLDVIINKIMHCLTLYKTPQSGCIEHERTVSLASTEISSHAR